MNACETDDRIRIRIFCHDAMGPAVELACGDLSIALSPPLAVQLGRTLIDLGWATGAGGLLWAGAHDEELGTIKLGQLARGLPQALFNAMADCAVAPRVQEAAES
ncbi:MAG TPA: hypothetical protein VFD49_09250 [Candidatus Dormibacteraeota bacterium]|nr:hypothetical protein [Candidatus Dormibacteraeota bacterium]